jgi:hypothetical protein
VQGSAGSPSTVAPSSSSLRTSAMSARAAAAASGDISLCDDGAAASTACISWAQCA